MISPVTIPTVNANDENALLLKWYVPEGVLVKRGQLICEIETTKATVEVESEHEGYLVLIGAEGSRYPLGATIALLKSDPQEDHLAFLANLSQRAKGLNADATRRWTKKAFIVARRLGIDLEALAVQNPDKILNEEDVLAAENVSASSAMALAPLVPLDSSVERLLLLGGAGGAGTIALDALSRSQKQMAVGILDGNKNKHGRLIQGVPVLGSLDLVKSLWDQKVFDGAIILFTDDIKERAEFFLKLRAAGISFANLIDPSVSIRSGARFGTGNVVMANCFFAAEVVVGDNCFFASGTAVEHHSVIGSHCTFGPRCSTSGRVTIGDRVRLGMNIAIEPYVSVGEGSIVASGVVLTTPVPPKTVVKAIQGHTSRPLGR